MACLKMTACNPWEQFLIYCRDGLTVKITVPFSGTPYAIFLLSCIKLTERWMAKDLNALLRHHVFASQKL